MWRSLLLFGLLLAVLVPVAGVAQAQDIPAVYLYVNDLASPRALLDVEASEVSDYCYALDYETTAEIAILIVNTTLPMGIDNFASATFDANAIGKRGLDNGVLIIVSTDERAWRIEVGYGLTGILTNAVVGRIGRDIMEPYLRVDDVYHGVNNGTRAVGQLILDKYVPPGGRRSTPDLIVIDWRAVAIGVGIFILVSALTKGRVLLWVGNIFTRGGFGGGRSGGGGARGKF